MKRDKQPKMGGSLPVTSKTVHQDRSMGNKRTILEALGVAMAEVTAVLLKELLGSHAFVASDLLHVTRKEGRLALANVVHQVQQHFHLGVVRWLNLWTAILGRLLGVLGVLWIFGLLGILLRVLAYELLGVLIQTLEKAAEVPQTALAERASHGGKETWSVFACGRQRQLH